MIPALTWRGTSSRRAGNSFRRKWW